jgi:hypothetical protein
VRGSDRLVALDAKFAPSMSGASILSRTKTRRQEEGVGPTRHRTKLFRTPMLFYQVVNSCNKNIISVEFKSPLFNVTLLFFWTIYDGRCSPRIW